MPVVTYEIYAYQERRWRLSDRVEGVGRDDAVARAEAVFDEASVEAVSVIKEVFNQNDGTTREVETYSDAKRTGVTNFRGAAIRPRADRRSKSAPAQQQREPARESRVEARAAAPPSRPEGHATVGSALMPARAASPAPYVFAYKIFGVLAGGAVLALGLVYLLSAAGNSSAFGEYAAFAGQQNAQIKIFAVAAILFVVALVPFFYSREEFTALLNATVAAAAADKAPAGNSRNKNDAPATVADAADQEEDGARSEAGEDHPWFDDDEAGVDINAVVSEELLDEAKLAILVFFGRCLGHLKDSQQYVKGGRLNASNTFGCHLFVAGACEAYLEAKDLDGAAYPEVLRSCIEVLGRNARKARRFVANYESYFADPRSSEMFDAGRHAIERYLRDRDVATGAGDAPPGIGADLVAALDAWNKPRDQRSGEGTVAVLFTDIVSSTQFTQDHGDAHSQALVHAHNDIVRRAIQRFEGREIKHTGDGIMTAFKRISAAVEAAVEMQRGAEWHTRECPELPLGLCIGISAGEPIREDGDLFSTSVQLAARLCGAAKGNDILVSAAVRDLCAGKNITFVDGGSQDFKGFKEPVELVEVAWRDGAANDAGSGDATPAAARSGWRVSPPAYGPPNDLLELRFGKRAHRGRADAAGRRQSRRLIAPPERRAISGAHSAPDRVTRPARPRLGGWPARG